WKTSSARPCWIPSPPPACSPSRIESETAPKASRRLGERSDSTGDPARASLPLPAEAGDLAGRAHRREGLLTEQQLELEVLVLLLLEALPLLLALPPDIVLLGPDLVPLALDRACQPVGLSGRGSGHDR